MVVLQITCLVLAVVFNRLLGVLGLQPFRRISLRGPSVHSTFNSKSTSFTIV